MFESAWRVYESPDSPKIKVSQSESDSAEILWLSYFIFCAVAVKRLESLRNGGHYVPKHRQKQLALPLKTKRGYSSRRAASLLLIFIFACIS